MRCDGYATEVRGNLHETQGNAFFGSSLRQLLLNSRLLRSRECNCTLLEYPGFMPCNVLNARPQFLNMIQSNSSNGGDDWSSNDIGDVVLSPMVSLVYRGINAFLGEGVK